MNCYTDIAKLKRRLNMASVTTNDTEFSELLNAASRQIDKYCDRKFYVKSETRYFPGVSSRLWINDLLSINTSGFKTDEDGDATFENTLATTDYILYPLNSYPKTRIELSDDSDYGGFGTGVKRGVQIAGLWGYGDGESATPYYADTSTAEALDASETGIDVTSAANLRAGMTILVESEQMYISEIVNNVLTVTRAVNGTTAATHTTLNQIYVYQYPDTIVEACIIQAMRWWKRKDSAYQDSVGNPETGMLNIYKGIDPDIKEIIKPFRRFK